VLKVELLGFERLRGYTRRLRSGVPVMVLLYYEGVVVSGAGENFEVFLTIFIRDVTCHCCPCAYSLPH
jgi:hypothetical protein